MGFLGAILGPSWALLGPSWGPLGPPWGHLGVILAHLGDILGTSWAARGHLQATCANLPPSWVKFASTWHLWGSILRPSGPSPGSFLDRFGPTWAHSGPILKSSWRCPLPSWAKLRVLLRSLTIPFYPSFSCLYTQNKTSLEVAGPLGASVGTRSAYNQ